MYFKIWIPCIFVLTQFICCTWGTHQLAFIDVLSTFVAKVLQGVPNIATFSRYSSCRRCIEELLYRLHIMLSKLYHFVLSTMLHALIDNDLSPLQRAFRNGKQQGIFVRFHLHLESRSTAERELHRWQVLTFGTNRRSKRLVPVKVRWTWFFRHFQ